MRFVVTPEASAQGRERSGHLVAPPGDGPWPGVVVLHELFGLTDDIRALADRVAAFGYLTIAPDLYDGAPWRKAMRPALAQVQAGQGPAFDAIDAARRTLLADEACTGTVAVLGVSLGGMFALRLARTGDYRAAVAAYADVPEDVDMAGACPTLALYGARDRSLRGRPERLRAALGDTGEVVVLPEAGHSFLATEPYPTRAIRALSAVMRMHAGPHPAAAADAWARIDAFLARHLG
jgi:carboxymethylenebutenolidase